jgi:PPOX class probable F420-dependent enzyme
MNQVEAEQFVRETKQAILATIGKDGRPQTSNVLVVYHNGQLLLSTSQRTAKFRNMMRDPRVTVHLLGGTFWAWLAVEGTVSSTPMPAALPELHTYYELATGGPHPDWEEYDRAMEDEQRAMVRISIERMYPITE